MRCHLCNYESESERRFEILDSRSSSDDILACYVVCCRCIAKSWRNTIGEETYRKVKKISRARKLSEKRKDVVITEIATP